MTLAAEVAPDPVAARTAQRATALEHRPNFSLEGGHVLG